MVTLLSDYVYEILFMYVCQKGWGYQMTLGSPEWNLQRKGSIKIIWGPTRQQNEYSLDGRRRIKHEWFRVKTVSVVRTSRNEKQGFYTQRNLSRQNYWTEKVTRLEDTVKCPRLPPLLSDKEHFTVMTRWSSTTPTSLYHRDPKESKGEDHTL